MKPENCCFCGKPTQSHNVAIDRSEYDEVGLPTLAGVACHTCWTGDTDGVPRIESILDDEERLYDLADKDYLVSVPARVEDLV